MSVSSKTVPPAVVGTWPPLHDAIWRASNNNNDLSQLQALLQNGADIRETSDSHGWTNATVLHTAADSEIELFDLLLDNGARELLEIKCGPGEEGRWSGQTVLQYAAKHSRTKIAERLIAVGADYDIFSAIALGDMLRVTQLVEQEQSVLASTDDYQAPLLHWAAATDQIEAAEFLVERGADIEARDDFDETALLVASVRQSRLSRNPQGPTKNKSLVDFLLTQDAKVDVHAAAALGDNITLKRLLENERGLASSTNAHGTTPLHWAARNAHLDSARLLLEHDADIDSKDNIGCPPLWYAAYWGYDAAMTEFLCESGADVGFRNIWRKEIGSYDIGHGNRSIISSYQK